LKLQKKSQKGELAQTERGGEAAPVGGLLACDICREVITEPKDIELNIRVSHMMRKESRLRHLYNEFRRSRGLPNADFEIL
jgi:hypothetical protein